MADANKRYDPYGQRMTNCCGDFSTYGTNVDIHNLDTVQKTCVSCGEPTGEGEGDQTNFLPGVTHEQWLEKFMGGKATGTRGKLILNEEV